MKLLNHAVLTTALAAMLATGSQAAEFGVPTYMIERPAVPQFGGFHMGVIGGYTFGTAEFSSPLVPGIVVEDDLDGPDGGVAIGYDLQNGSYFTGIELFGALGGPEKSYVIGPLQLDYGIDAHVDARIRAGFLASDMLALYAIGGGTYARTFAQISGGGLGKLEEEEWRLGWLLGAGGEVLVTQNLSVGAEYTFTDLRAKTYFDAITTEGHFNAVRASARYRF